MRQLDQCAKCGRIGALGGLALMLLGAAAPAPPAVRPVTEAHFGVTVRDPYRGEYGEDWHFAAHIATKQRTVDDFIGCARYLIEQHYTTPAKLAGSGTSAGGVTIGNAIAQHPER